MGITIIEQQTMHAIQAIPQQLKRIADALEAADEPKSPTEPLPLTKAAWRSEVGRGKTEQGFTDWLEGRRSV